jgi:hypothetical protein
MTLGEALATPEEIMGSAAPVLDVFVSHPDRLLAMTTRIERLGRWVDALRVAAAAEIDALSGPELGSDGLASRLGCRNANELLQRVTHISGSTAARRLTLGAQTRSRATLTGYCRPPAFASVAAAMQAGEIGVDSASAIVSGLSPVVGSSNPELWLGAERELVQSATGRNPEELNGDQDRDPATELVSLVLQMRPSCRRRCGGLRSILMELSQPRRGRFGGAAFESAAKMTGWFP